MSEGNATLAALREYQETERKELYVKIGYMLVKYGMDFVKACAIADVIVEHRLQLKELL